MKEVLGFFKKKLIKTKANSDLKLAKRNMLNNNHNLAIGPFNKAIESGVLDVDELATALSDRSTCKLSSGDMTGALKDLDKALAIPDVSSSIRAGALQARGTLNYRNGNWKGTVEDLTEAIKSGLYLFSCNNARIMCGRALKQMGLFTDACNQFKTVLNDALATEEVKKIAKEEIAAIENIIT